MASADMVTPVSPSHSSGSSASRDELAAMLEAELDDAWGDAEDEVNEDAEKEADVGEDEEAGQPDSPKPTADSDSTPSQDHRDSKRAGMDLEVGRERASSHPGTSRRDDHAPSKRARGNPDRAASTGSEPRSNTPKESKSGGGCNHPGFMMGLCIACGAPKKEDPGGSRPQQPQLHPHHPQYAASMRQHADAPGGARATSRWSTGDAAEMDGSVQLRYIHPSLELSEAGALSLRAKEEGALLKRRRLCLVLDLDHTLLNSARAMDVQSHVPYLCQAYHVRPVVPPQNHHSGVPTRPNDSNEFSLYHLPYLNMWTKLRPGIHKFLEQMHLRYDLYVYTNGERLYADAMARLLDPSGRLFGGRVIAWGDSKRLGVKNLDVVLGCDNLALILDDSENVWPRHRQNLIHVERYHFFTSSRGEFSLAGPGLAEEKRDEVEAEDEGGLLLSLASLLDRVWESFFARLDKEKDTSKRAPDVREVLLSARAKILAGCHLVFSRVFPTDMASPEAHPLWQKARAMGATCHMHVGPKVTHVVALDCATDKAIWATTNGKFLVTPAWLERSWVLWRRAGERGFKVGTGKGLVGWAPSHNLIPTVDMPERPALPAEDPKGKEDAEIDVSGDGEAVVEQKDDKVEANADHSQSQPAGLSHDNQSTNSTK